MWRVRIWFRYTLPRLLRHFFGWVGRGFKPEPPVVFANIRVLAEYLAHWPDDDDVKRGEAILSHRIEKDHGFWLTFVMEPNSGKAPEYVPAYGVYGILIGSIVEGVDACVDTDPLYFPFTEKDYDETIEYVGGEVDRIWNETHGCSHCWTRTACDLDDPDDPCVSHEQRNDGRVDPECLHCGGDGVVI